MNRYMFLQKLGLGSPLCERYTFIYLYKLVIKHYVVYGMDQVKEKSNLSLSGPPGFTCWISFAPVFSLIYC